MTTHPFHRLGYWQRVIGRVLRHEPQSLDTLHRLVRAAGCDYSLHTMEASLASMVEKGVAAKATDGYVRGANWSQVARKYGWK